jgi:hypothetical protein
VYKCDGPKAEMVMDNRHHKCRMNIDQVRLGVRNLETTGLARMEARRASRYQVHGRRLMRTMYPKPGVKKKTCKVKVD